MRALSSTVLTAFLLTSLVACGGGGSGSDTVIGATPPLLVASTLTQREVIPPSGSAATGEANFAVNLDDDSLSGDVVLTALQASAVDIRDSFAGEKGTLVLALEQGVDASQWRVPDGTQLTVGDLSRLQSGALYVAATGVGPEIDIRGQLIPSGVDLMLADMTGSQEVPALQVASSGVAAMTVDTATRVAQMHVNVIDTASPVIAAHMHQAFAGDNGGVEVGLQEDVMTMAGDPAHWFATDVQLTDAQYQRLRRGESYFNAHTPNHPGGEVRGQIIPPDIELFFDDLSGLQVVGDGITISAVNTTASAKASTTVDTAAQSITVYVNTTELDDANAVALHQAPEGQNGPAVATFVEEPDDDDPDDGVTRRWTLADLMLTLAEHTAFRNQLLYAKVATPTFPVGEVRGQLLPPGSNPVTDPSAFQVVTRSFQTNEILDAFPTQITVTFNKPVLADSINDMNMVVESSGGDMDFGNGNETIVVPTNRTVASADANTVELDFSGSTAGEDTYRLHIVGDPLVAPPLTDTEGLIFDGDMDTIPGGDYSALFAVAMPPAPTLTQVQAQVFSVNCTNAGCHDAAGTAAAQSLVDGNSFANLVNRPSIFGGTRVIPNDPDNSVLVRRLEGDITPQMPLGQAPLDAGLIQLVRDWIANGALND